MANALAIGRALRANLSETISVAMIRARMAVSDATPVKTHHAESNWVLSVGSPYNGVDGSPYAVSYAAQQEGDQRIKRYDVGRDGKIYLRDNVIYMQFLNKGSSPQAEPGFVAEAFQRGADGVPYGRRGAARKLLRNMSRSAYLRTY